VKVCQLPPWVIWPPEAGAHWAWLFASVIHVSPPVQHSWPYHPQEVPAHCRRSSWDALWRSLSSSMWTGYGFAAMDGSSAIATRPATEAGAFKNHIMATQARKRPNERQAPSAMGCRRGAAVSDLIMVVSCGVDPRGLIRLGRAARIAGKTGATVGVAITQKGQRRNVWNVNAENVWCRRRNGCARRCAGGGRK
jgi:hypothetical protein